MNDSKLIIALTKGRILQETLPLLLTAGIQPLEDVTTSRKLLFETGEPDVRLLIMRGSDVPTYVRFGSADMGIAGKDLILEGGRVLLIHGDCRLHISLLELLVVACGGMGKGRREWVREREGSGRAVLLLKAAVHAYHHPAPYRIEPAHHPYHHQRAPI